MHSRVIPNSPWRFGRFAFVALLIIGTCLGSAMAVDPLYYDSRGIGHKLIKSPDEVAVRYERGEEAAGAADVRGSTEGELTAVPWNASNPRMNILTVKQATRSRRDAVRALKHVRSVRPVYRFEGSDQPVLSSGSLVVKVAPWVTDADRDQMFADYGLGDVQALEGMNGVYTARPVADPDEDEVVRAAALHLDDRTLWAHPNFITPKIARQAVPDDEFYDDQWHLNNTGQNGGTSGADIDVFTAWATTLGSDVTIGAFDDGFDVDHEDLRGNYLDVGHDPANGDGDPRPKLLGDRHGTAVMGLICAEANELGVRGVAPQSRFTCSRGLSEFLTDAEVAGVYTFARQTNVDVHNNSWGFIFTPDPPVVVDAIETAFIEGRGGRGMVVVFASGNFGIEITPGFELSALPTVIGVGASSPDDFVTPYSNFGFTIDVLAPSNDDGFFYGVVTTDNEDDAGYSEPGYNNDGFNDFGLPNLPDSSYTDDFGGTSAACPITSGVAALCLAVNPDLTATQVRCILEHTADKIATSDAQYDGVTSRSLTYGYGRINAAEAVAAALQSTTNGGLTWPDTVAEVNVSGTTLSWDNNNDLRTVEVEGEDQTFGDEVTRVLVLQGSQTFSYVPEVGAFPPNPITGEDFVGDEVEGLSGVFIAHNGPEESLDFSNATGTQVFAMYAANAAGRFSFGTFVDSNGNVVNGGELVDTGGGSTGGEDPIVVGSETPKITISVTPTSGKSPLLVSFAANALSDSAIVSNEWDFGDGSPVSTERNTLHTYEVSGGSAGSFIATFTATDEEGDTGSRSFAVNVEAASTDSGGITGPINVDVRVETPGAPGSDNDSGTSPFSVNLTFDSDTIPDGVTVSGASWDLGDGSTSTSLSVPHTYVNSGDAAITIPVTLTLTFVDSFGQTIVSEPATRLITVLPGSSTPDNTNDSSDPIPNERAPTAGDARVCGLAALYAFPAMLMMALTWRGRRNSVR